MVGLSGTLVNLAILTSFMVLAVPLHFAFALAIAGSMIWNFVLNRRFSFSYARSRSWTRQFIGFLTACSAGAIVNYVASVGVLTFWPSVRPQVAAVIGVVASMGFNFVAARYCVQEVALCRWWTMTIRTESSAPNVQRIAPLAIPERSRSRPAALLLDVLSFRGCLIAFFIPAAAFLSQQSLWVDETTQLSGLTLGPLGVVHWLVGGPPTSMSLLIECRR